MDEIITFVQTRQNSKIKYNNNNNNNKLIIATTNSLLAYDYLPDLEADVFGCGEWKRLALHRVGHHVHRNHKGNVICA
jgi:hypothetical protein